MILIDTSAPFRHVATDEHHVGGVAGRCIRGRHGVREPSSHRALPAPLAGATTKPTRSARREQHRSCVLATSAANTAARLTVSRETPCCSASFSAVKRGSD